MARHRAIRNTKSYEYDDYDDYAYGQSYEDDYYGVSPGTMAQYSYNRQTDVGLSHFIPSESTVQEESEHEVFENENKQAVQNGGVDVSKEDPALVNSCMEQIRDAVGDHFSDDQIKTTLKLYKYDVDRSINHLLSSPNIKTLDNNQSGHYAQSNLFFNEHPLQQRQPKNRRRDRNTNFNVDDNLSTKPKQPAMTKIEVATVKATNKTPVKTGFDTLAYQSPSQGCVVKSQDKKSGMVSSDLFNAHDKKTVNFLSNAVSELEVTHTATTTSGKSQKDTNIKSSVENYRLSKHAAHINLKHQEHLKTSKPQFSLVVIGHVDAGKSTLMGHILYKCGEVSKKTMHKYEKESKKLGKSSFAYAWVLDETEEERNRGVTMDVGLTKFETEHKNIILLDAPGHKDFIPNMITGASQADVALLVINATTGEFEAGFDLGGQTREHSLLVRSLGVSQLAVAVNKLDTVDWSERRFKEIVKKLQSFLKQAGFKENEVTYVPVSGLLGENLTEKSKDENLISWYQGPCLLDVIDNFKPPSRPVDYPFRFCVNDVYKGQGAGIQVSGKVETGGVSIGDKVIILPAGETSLIKGIELQDNSKREVAFAGDHVTLSCHGVDMMKIQTGNVISSVANQIGVVSRFQARLIVFNTDIPITKGFSVELLYKASSEPAVLRKLINVLHKSTGDVQFKHPKMLLKGQNATVSIEVFRPICIEEYSKVKEMGRITLRYGGTTIAAGVVTKLLKNA